MGPIPGVKNIAPQKTACCAEPASPPSELSGKLTNHRLLDKIVEVLSKLLPPIAGSFVFWQGQIIGCLLMQTGFS